MAKFVKTVECKCCGKVVGRISIFTSELCQKCGTQILIIDRTETGYCTTENSQSIVAKERDCIFFKTYKKVRDITDC